LNFVFNEIIDLRAGSVELKRLDYTVSLKATNKEPTVPKLEAERASDAWNDLFSVRGVKADKYVIKFLYYYMGEGPAGEISTSLHCRRTRIMPSLRKVKTQGLQCEAKYKALCADEELWKVHIQDIDNILANKPLPDPQYCIKYYSKVMGKSANNPRNTLLIK
jgi:hypothetical protein